VQQLSDIKRALDQAAIVPATDITGRFSASTTGSARSLAAPDGELLGQDHRIISSRHHPWRSFRDMWQTIARGEKRRVAW
jgi:hypothetical protein